MKVAIIGALGAIIAAVITVLLPKLFEQRNRFNDEIAVQVPEIKRVRLEGEEYDKASAHVRIGEGGIFVGWINDGEWIAFENVNFGTSGLDVAKAHYASGEADGVMTIRLDDPHGRAIGSCNLHATGGWLSWASVPCELEAAITGIHRVTLLFNGKGTYIANLDWLEFSL